MLTWEEEIISSKKSLSLVGRKYQINHPEARTLDLLDNNKQARKRTDHRRRKKKQQKDFFSKIDSSTIDWGIFRWSFLGTNRMY